MWKDKQTKTAPMWLCPQDIEQLHRAKDILVQQAKMPPTLVELARMVGVNERKLKQGFRQL